MGKRQRNNFADMRNQRMTATIAGISLLAMVIVAGLEYSYGFEHLYLSHNEHGTLNNLNQFRWLLTLVIASFILILILDVIVAWALYALFRGVSKLRSLISSGLRLVYSLVLGKAICYLLPVLSLSEGSTQESAALMNNPDSFLNVWSLGQSFLAGISLCRLCY